MPVKGNVEKIIQLMFWANVLNGVLAPVLVVYLIVVGNNRKVMRNQPIVGLPTWVW
jgi:Mn2+/Fe2+ NRAMP family transporter